MDFIQNVSVAVVTSAVTISLLVFFVREYIRKLLDYEFLKRKTKFDEEEKSKSEKSGNGNESSFGIGNLSAFLIAFPSCR